MDAANGVPGRPLNWLPSAFIRADSVVLQLKAFSVTHAVKALLSLKNKPQQQKKDSWVFQPSAKPLVPTACQCESLCECGEDDYEDEEFQYQLCASDVCFRRQSRSPTQNWASVQNFSWARSLAKREIVECASSKITEGNSEKTPPMWTASVSPGRKDDADKKEPIENSVMKELKENSVKKELKENSVKKELKENSVKKELKENSVKKELKENSVKKELKENSVKVRSSEALESESHATPSHNTTIAHEEIAGSQRAPLLSLSSPKWWPLGVQSAASPAVESKWNFRMGQNAGAGALAGGVVSLCLHPVDTLKTIVQSQTGGSRNLLPILSSIISERGLRGLYRGLGSNLASSAPISAIYTLTYEAVKAGLLRHIPADMSALAHCGAGACASVATSIVFTPSECVKQQMQVNGLYQNSWQTFTSLLKQGGLPMLYKGWGAVLCRNVPQSVIKFYTYEALKHWAIARGDQPRDTPLPTLQALAIGGIAGSTAAFFTTPFDVVKTRLQTQIPGSVQQYNGVIHTFRIIATTEGVPGLYRGLVPRLVIYVTQGALFFASYEFIKHVLAVEVPRLRIKASQIEGYQRQSAPIPAEST